MRIAALKENNEHENRVSITPDTISLFSRLGFEILIEENAGQDSGFPNNLYVNAGALLKSRK